MTSSVILSHKDAFANAQLLESYEALDKIQIHGFGVRGKHFVLIKKKTSFMTRIWFSFLKFLRIIKTDGPSIEKLKTATVSHLETDDYKEWSKTHGKVTKQGVVTLIGHHQATTEELKLAEKNAKTHEELAASTQTKVNEHLTTIQRQILRISELEDECDRLSHCLNAAKAETNQARQSQDPNQARILEMELIGKIKELQALNETLATENGENATRLQKYERGKRHYKHLTHKQKEEIKNLKETLGKLEGLKKALPEELSSDELAPKDPEPKKAQDDSMEKVADHLDSIDGKPAKKDAKDPKKKAKTIRRSDSKRHSRIFGNLFSSRDKDSTNGDEAPADEPKSDVEALA